MDKLIQQWFVAQPSRKWRRVISQLCLAGVAVCTLFGGYLVYQDWPVGFFPSAVGLFLFGALVTCNVRHWRQADRLMFVPDDLLLLISRNSQVPVNVKRELARRAAENGQIVFGDLQDAIDGAAADARKAELSEGPGFKSIASFSSQKD